jgi:hypothetical protein
VVQDAMRGWRTSRSSTTDLEGVVAEVAKILGSYGVRQVHGDRYGGQWVREAFRRAGVAYLDPPADRSGCYLELEPLLAQGRVELLDHSTMLRELRNLERRPRQGGKVVVDHPSGGHDDHANALAIAAAVCATVGPRDLGITLGRVSL